jgi:N-succinyldiaminopimelate aminotransferase
MNPLLSSLQPYPFERLKQLFSTVTPNPAHAPISRGIGEPRHATPQLVLDALAKATAQLVKTSLYSYTQKRKLNMP